MRGKVWLIAAAVATLVGCGNITPIPDLPDGGKATTSVEGQLDGSVRPGPPAAKKNGDVDQADQAGNNGDGPGRGPGAS